MDDIIIITHTLTLRQTNLFGNQKDISRLSTNSFGQTVNCYSMHLRQYPPILHCNIHSSSCNFRPNIPSHILPGLDRKEVKMILKIRHQRKRKSSRLEPKSNSDQTSEPSEVKRTMTTVCSSSILGYWAWWLSNNTHVYHEMSQCLKILNQLNDSQNHWDIHFMIIEMYISVSKSKSHPKSDKAAKTIYTLCGVF